MSKIAILTINDNNNYGNRLQNYAIQEILKKENFEVETIWNDNNKGLIFYIKFYLKLIIKKVLFKNYFYRNKNFVEFTKNISHSKIKINNKKLPTNLTEQYDYFITGSDQVWNPNFNRLSDIDLLSFAEPQKRISFSASFGIDKLDERYHKKVKNELSKFKKLSIREDKGREIVEKITERKDVEVLIDPTMLLTSEEWNKISKKPKMLKNNKFILNYFLGELSSKRKKEINRIAQENNCEVINILDKNSPFYECGPSEFLWLENNAFLICTDSFHSSVFAILYNTPFLVFDREDNNISMNSRLETLLKKFNLQDRKYQDKISNEHLYFDNKEASKILEKEREKSINWLKDALDLEK